VVEEAEAGLVVSPDSSAGIVAAAERFLVDRALCAECGTNGRRYAERHFSIDAIADRFLSVLEGQAEREPRELVLASGESERKESWKHPA
jgi:glycosyltransferase involved in cell wall biosynthesis